MPRKSRPRITKLIVPLLLQAIVLSFAVTAQGAVTNGQVAFSSNAGVADYDIYGMNSDGTSLAQISISGVGVSNIEPAWSPDGTKIVFSSDRDTNYEIYSMNADGTAQTRLTTDVALDVTPAWSPDGTRIVFRSNRDPDTEIFVMNANGSGQANLTSNSVADYSPSWSPDGSKIVFSSDRGSGLDIYSMNANGTLQTQLTNAAFSDDAPEWSPDGSKIVFTSQRDGGSSEIYVMNADGTSQTRLTTGFQGTNLEPTWSPDGTKIAFRSDRGATEDIYTMNADGTVQANLTNMDLSGERQPTWQPIIVADPSVPPEQSPTPAPGSGSSEESKSFKFTNPKLNAKKTKRVKRKKLYNYLRRGFKGEISGYEKLRGSFVRVVKRRAKSKAKKSAKKKKKNKRCYRIVRERTPCKRTASKGISLKTLGSTTTFTFKPLGKSMRPLRRLKKGRKIRRGLYHLTIKAKPKAGGEYKKFTYKLRVK